ncbi:FAD:protein FMN transferase [Pedobacter frigoris]|uniref:FAD:protein FMN transferase n=1 Tax=Pedobacter frigoris TaxID=2571272 RepID=A0A4U1CCD4_9SPHI|nr:FAD:protein FMN transferase [Pedobacter frigoris]TKC02837.1 FAD:protein FMN transferase [Pedobacter frigoris]
MFSVNKSILLSISLLISSFFGKDDQRQFTIQGYAQGTDYTVKYFALDSIITKGAVDSILSVIDSSMSLYKPYSRICKFNASKNGLELDAHFKNVMAKSFEINKATSGKFDVTVAPLVQAWGFGAKPIQEFPDIAAVKNLLKSTGMKHLRLKGNYLTKNSETVQVDLNGIAQGYSVDVVADHLLKKGIKAFVVEIGGELRMKGPKPDGSAMRIGIEGPSPVAGAEPVVRHVISINNGAITTSGNYRKFLQKGSKKVTHLIDPKTGYPLNNEMISVTVYAKDAITADGYDNALMAMDVKQALAFVERKKDMEAYIIYHRKDGNVADTLSKGFRKLITD